MTVGGIMAAVAAAAATSSAMPKPGSSPAVVVVTGSSAVPAAPVVDPGKSATPAASAGTVSVDKVLAGINISGGEFGTVPGKLGYQYSYPTIAEIDAFHALGFKMIRIPFRWERLQPTLYGSLSPADRKGLKTATDHATAKGMVVVLDMHDYARRRATTGAATSSIIGSATLTGSALSDAWTKISEDYRGNTKVWLGLMNEPNGLSATDWWRSVQQVTQDLRGQRITNKLLIPGNSWTGAHSWIKSGNAALAEKFVDPDNNYAFEVHQYLDKDSSGTSGTCSVGAGNRVNSVLNWAQTHRVKLFFGEIASSGEAQCQTEYGAMLTKLNASTTVVGWTAWGAGKWWNASYPFKLSGAVSTPHMTLLQQHMPK